MSKAKLLSQDCGGKEGFWINGRIKSFGFTKRNVYDIKRKVILNLCTRQNLPRTVIKAKYVSLYLLPVVESEAWSLEKTVVMRNHWKRLYFRMHFKHYYQKVERTKISEKHHFGKSEYGGISVEAQGEQSICPMEEQKPGTAWWQQPRKRVMGN